MDYYYVGSTYGFVDSTYSSTYAYQRAFVMSSYNSRSCLSTAETLYTLSNALYLTASDPNFGITCSIPLINKTGLFLIDFIKTNINAFATPASFEYYC